MDAHKVLNDVAIDGALRVLAKVNVELEDCSALLDIHGRACGAAFMALFTALAAADQALAAGLVAVKEEHRNGNG